MDTTIGAAEQPVAKAMKQLGYVPVRQLMLHTAAEANRYLAYSWGWAEIVLALIVIGMLFSVKAGPASFGAAGLALLMALGIQFVMTPELTGLGRLLDFIAENAMYAERSRLASLQRIYLISRVLVMLLSAGLLVAFLRRTRSRRLTLNPLNQVNAVYNSNDAHVDG